MHKHKFHKTTAEQTQPMFKFVQHDAYISSYNFVERSKPRRKLVRVVRRGRNITVKNMCETKIKFLLAPS